MPRPAAEARAGRRGSCRRVIAEAAADGLDAGRPRFAWYPFLGGPHQCIGEPLAWLEGVVVLATVAQQWRLRLVPGHKVELEPLATLLPKGGLPMLVEKR